MVIRNNVTNSYPAIIHAPDTRQNWDKLCALFFAQPHYPAKVDPRLTVLTWNNLESSVLERCLDARQLPYMVLGKSCVVWNNLKKFDLNVEAMQAISTPYVMGLDSHDVLFIGDPSKVVDEFERMECDILFNSETHFYPNFPLSYFTSAKSFQRQVGKKWKYKYLNSGAWIGRTDFCIKFFSDCRKVRLWERFDCTNYKKLFNCDQSVVHSRFEKYFPLAALDYECKIFNNISLIDNSEISTMVKLV